MLLCILGDWIILLDKLCKAISCSSIVHLVVASLHQMPIALVYFVSEIIISLILFGMCVNVVCSSFGAIVFVVFLVRIGTKVKEIYGV